MNPGSVPTVEGRFQCVDQPSCVLNSISRNDRIAAALHGRMRRQFALTAIGLVVALALYLAGAWAQAPSTYSAYTGTDPKPVPPAPALGAANSVINDPTSAQNTNNFGADTFDLMSRAAASLFAAGRLDDVRIYNRALSTSEIVTLATNTPPQITPVSITTTSLPGGAQSTAYIASVAATGGTTPFTWSISSGTLPSGLALAASAGVISGVPTGTGTSNFTVQVTDAASQTATQALSITISSATSATTRFEQTSSTASYSPVGDWATVKRRYYSGGSATTAMTAGDSVSFTFTGSAVRWIGYKDEWSGIANVYLNGQFQATVDTYGSPSQNQPVVWGISGLASTTHTLKIVAQGTQNPASGGSWVWVDAFDVTQ